MNLNTDPPHYNPEDGKWDGQLANPDLVDQLDPPVLKPKIFDRMAWADGVVRARRYRGPTAAVFHRMTVRAGTEDGCFESVGSMASGLGISRSSVQRAIKTIAKDGYMTVEERIKQTYLCRPNFTARVSDSTPRVSQCDPSKGRTVTPEGNPSSSKGKVIERNPVVDPNQGAPKTKEPETTETTRVSSLSEEEKTGVTGVTNRARPMAHADEVDAWLSTNMPAQPMTSFVLPLLKHYKKFWWRPFVSDGWESRTSIAKAAKYYTASLETWRQLRIDLRDKMLAGGLPPVIEYEDGKPKLTDPVRCDFPTHDGDRLTMNFGEANKIIRPVEGQWFFDVGCGVCLSQQPVAVGV